MTTTVPAMEQTIQLLRQEVPGVKVMVGGAVLTQEYADMIGADFYAADAMGSVRDRTIGFSRSMKHPGRDLLWAIWLARSELMFGKAGLARLAASRVAVFGVGGVGGAVVEALARSGIGSLDLIDSDRVSLSNLNRQLIALHSTMGQKKISAAAARARDINPQIKIEIFDCFYLPETADQFDFTQYDYIVDAIDTVAGKTELAVRAARACVPILSSMGFANKADPTRIQVCDIYKTKVCPLAKAMRSNLRRAGIEHLKVVFSDEEPHKQAGPGRDEQGAKIIGSNAFVPPVAGFVLAGEVIKDLIGYRNGCE